MSNKHDTVKVTLIARNADKETGIKRERTVPVLRSHFENAEWKKDWVAETLGSLWEIKNVA